MVAARLLAILLCLPFTAAADDDFLNAVLTRARAHLARLSDFVCAQDVERSERSPAQQQFRLKDRLHLEVTSIGGKERFAKAGGARFDDRELHQLVTRGVVSTGSFVSFLRHVTQLGPAEFRLGADAELAGRPVKRYEFHVPWERSGYTIAVPPHQANVGFHGSLLADLESRDIVRLEIAADEIPPELGFDRTQTVLTYRMVAVGNTSHLFAAETETLAVMIDGNEYRSRAELGTCRQYAAESSISFAGETRPAPTVTAAAPAPPPSPLLRRNLLVEITLDHEISLADATPDSAFRATLAEPLKDGETVLAPAGAPVVGRVLALERISQPVDRYEVVLRLDSIELPGGERQPLAARLRDTGGGSGLIRQEKRMMPEFSKKRTNRFSVLVRESGPEQAVLYWDAKSPRIKKGFRMRWLTDSLE